VPLARGQRDFEAAGHLFEPSVTADEQVEDRPLVLIREVGVLDQRAPACLHLAQALTQNFEPVPAAEEQLALRLITREPGWVASSAKMQAFRSSTIGSAPTST